MSRVPWRAPDVRWDDYDVVIVRSTWDYTDDPERFFEVLETIDASHAALANPLTVMRWNAHKGYLLELQDTGVPIVPTRSGAALTDDGLTELANEFGSRRFVLKPAVGANAEHAFVLGICHVIFSPGLGAQINRPGMPLHCCRNIVAPAEYQAQMQRRVGGRDRMVEANPDFIRPLQVSLRSFVVTELHVHQSSVVEGQFQVLVITGCAETGGRCVEDRQRSTVLAAHEEHERLL